MRKIYTFLAILLSIVSAGVNAQNVTVAGCTGSGNGSYATLAAAATAIGTAQPAANITVTITTNTTETLTSTFGVGTWTTLKITPSGARTISGAIAAGSALIDLNGADNVTIDGLNTGGNSLIISNTTASATSGTSTIRFIGGATNNLITNSSILGSFSAAVGTNGGDIYFATDAVTTAGNDNNTISNNIIGPAGANLPTKCIYGNGSTSTTAINNSGIVINNNAIYDYFGAAVTSAGIYVTSGNTDWTISNNKFYQTATRTQTTGAQHSAIQISNTSGNNFAITSNTIGYSSASATGTYTFVGVSSSSVLIPIFLSVGSTTATSVQGNTITAIAMSGASSGTSSSAAFRGIYVSVGLVTVGNVTGNTIGSQSATGAITYTSSSSSASDVIAIFNFGSDNFITNNNTIGGITVGNSSTGAANLYGIRTNTGSTVTWTCNNNTVGGTVANSMQSTSTATGTIVNGILNSNPIGTFTGNTIRNLTSAGGTGTTSSSSISGWCSVSSAAQTITGNTIYSLLSSAAGTVNAIMGTSGSTVAMSGNKIYDIAGSNASSFVNGINISGGTTNNISNNIIGDLRATIANNANAVVGINLPGGTTDNVYYNTIYLNASSTGTVFGSSAISVSTTPAVTLRNNILVNNSTSNSTGLSVAYRRSSTTLTSYGATSNNNDLYATVIYYDGTTSYATFGPGAGSYKNLVATRDAASISENPNFLSTLGSDGTFLHINTTAATGIESGGATISGFTTDYDGDTRGGTPDIGADEFTGIALPACSGTPTASISGSNAVCSGSSTTLTATPGTVSSGLTYQWSSGTASGGPYGTTMGTNSTQSTGNLSTTTYFVVTVTCINGGGSSTSSEKVVSINAAPSLSVTPTSGGYCSVGGTPVSITASGAVSYAWSPSTGLNTTTGATVTASPASSRTYTVTGTGANSCTSTATSTITVGTPVTISSTTASPSSICSGGASTLSASASVSVTTASAMIYSSSTGQTLETMTSSTSAVTGSSSSGIDDAYVQIAPSSFTFNYLGTNYTTFTAGTNGYVVLGTTTTTSIPSSLTSIVNNVIYAFGRDGNINPTNGGSIDYGPAAGGKFVFQFTKTSGGASGVESATIYDTYQIVLWGSTSTNPGQIDIIYGTSAGTPGSAGTMGIADAAGTHINSIDGSTSTTTTSTNWPISGQKYTFSKPSVTYSWSPAGDVVSPNSQTTVTNSLSADETFNVTASYGGCTATGSTTVTVVSNATITTQPGNQVKCSGNTATFTVAAAGPGLTYVWEESSDGGGSFNSISDRGIYSGSSTASLTLTGVTVGMDGYKYRVWVSATCGSPIATDENATLSVTATPSATVSSNSPVCSGNTLSLTGTSDIGTTFTWSGPNSFSATTTNASVSSATSLAAGTYTYTASANGCSASGTTAVVINASPTAVTATATPASICTGSASALTSSGYVQNTASLPATYTFAGSAGTYAAITGTSVTGTTMLGDDVGVGNLPIGFTFNYNGTAQTLFAISSNGFIQLGNSSATITGFSSNALASTANVIAPLWDDNNTTGGTVQYLTSGSAGSRVLTVQWTGLHVAGSGSSSNPTIDVQVQLYEATGAIKFVYGSTSAALSSPTASIGISGASGNFISVTPLNPASSSTTSTSTENASIASAANFPTGTTYTFTPPSTTLTYAWSPATDVVSPTSQNTNTVALTADDTYTITVTNSGCSTTANVTVTVVSSATISTQPANQTACAGANATFTVVATGPGLTYQWEESRNGGGSWNTITNGAPYSGATTATLTLTGVTTSMNTYQYRAQVLATCGSPVATNGNATLTVNATPTAGASSNTPVCTGSSLNLTGTTNVGTTYSWTGPNSFTSTQQNPSISNVTSAAAGTYSFTATANGCSSTTATTAVLVNTTPSTVTVTPASTAFCAGGSVGLTATGGTVTSSGSATLGTGTGTTSATAQPTAFCNRWAQYWNQTIYTAAELSAAGLTTGASINSVAYTTTSQGDATNNTNFRIRIATTASTTLAAFQTTGFTIVYGPTSYTHAIGSNVITFTTPYVWDGTSNIILDVRQDGVDLTNNSITTFTAAADNKNIEAHTSTTSATTDIQTLVSNSSVTPTASTTRLNIIFAYSTVQQPTFSWSPSTGLNTTSGATVTASPSSTTTYSATATISGCSSLNSAVVTVNPLPTASIGGTTSVCKDATSPNVTFTGANGTAPYTFTYKIGTGSNQTVTTTSGNSVTVAAPTGTAGSFVYTLVSVQDASSTTCSQSQSGTATITVNPPPTTATNTSAQTICSTGTATLSGNTPSVGTGAWSVVSGPSSSSSQFSSTADPSATFTPAGGTGSYLVRWTISNSPCSASTADATIDVTSPPTSVLSGSTTICNSLSATLSVSLTGTAPWSLTYSDGTTPVTVNNITSNPYTFQVSPNSTKTYTITAMSDANCTSQSGDRTGSATVTINNNNTWLGLSSNWDNPANWSCGIVPNGSTVDAYIAATSVAPVLASDITVHNIIYQSTSGTDITIGGHMLTITGAISGGGFLRGGNLSSLVLNGAAGTVKFNSAYGALYNLTIGDGASATLGSALGVYNLVTIGGGGAVLNSAGFLTLKSNYATTGHVGQLSGGTITGNVTVERYIPGNSFQAWRLLSVPTQGSQTFRQAWQENQAPMVVGTPGYGTLIGHYAGTGFDYAATSGNASLKTWTPATGTFDVTINSTNTAMQTKSGYLLYIKGDRTITPAMSANTTSATVLRTTGTLYQGSQTSAAVPAGKYAVIGNIYPSAIDFTALSKDTSSTGLYNTYYVWDPKLYGNSGTGGYQTFAKANGWVPTPGGGSYGYNTPNTTIEQGQAFMVIARGTSTGTATVGFTEAAKVVHNANVFTRTTPMNRLSAALILNGHTDPADGNTVVFGAGYSENIPKAINLDENFAITAEEQSTSVSARAAAAKEGDRVTYNLSNLKEGQQYTIELNAENFNGQQAYLEDSYLHTTTPINLDGKTTVSFTANSTSTNRFTVVFGKAAPAITMVTGKITVAPNPVTGRVVNLQFSNKVDGAYRIAFTNAAGQSVYSTTVNHIGNNSIQQVKLPKLAQGIYHLQITTADGKMETQRVVVN